MSDFGHILENEDNREALVKRRVASLLKLYTNGRLGAKQETELRGYLGGRLPHEDEAPLVEPAPIAPPPSPAVAQETPVAATITPAPIAEPDRDQDHVAWLLRRWLHRAADAGDVAELQRLFPHAPNLVGHLTRATYKKPLIEYAKALGYKADATLKRWLDDGRACDPPDLPPFESPGQLAAWWQRVKKRKVPDELLAIAAAAPAAAPATNAGGDSATTPAPTESKPPPSSQSSSSSPHHEPLNEGTGFAASLERARHNERQAARALFDARKGDQIILIRAAQDTWHKAFQELRRAELDAAEILKANGEMVSWPEVENEVAEKLGVINQAIRSLMTRVATKVTVPPELLARLQRAFQDELDRVFEDLDKSGFDQPYKLAA